MTKSCNLLKYIVLTLLLMEAFPAEATCTTHTPLLEPASFVSDSPYQLAKTWFLPDWQNDTRSYNTSSGSDDKGGGDPWNDDNNNENNDNNVSSCSVYGFQETSTVDTSLYSCTVVRPLTGLTCYKDCVCKSDFQYTASNCSADAGKELSGRSCDGKYESCVCKPSVTLGAGEKCALSCGDNCVEKSCEASVSVGTGEECSECCASNTGICTAKKCKASVSYDSSKGEYCAESCASSSGTCTKKGCNKICKDTFTGSAPANGYITTATCSDCSGSYTVKTGWACSSGYNKSGNSCICATTCSDSVSVPANATAVKSNCTACGQTYSIVTDFTCNSGYTKSGSSCVKEKSCSDYGYRSTPLKQLVGSTRYNCTTVSVSGLTCYKCTEVSTCTPYFDKSTGRWVECSIK